MKQPTKKQADVLAFCGKFFAENDQLPPRHVICARFGWSSWNAADQMLRALRERGLIEYNEVGKYRFTAAGRAYIAQVATAARWHPTNGTAEPTSGNDYAYSAG